MLSKNTANSPELAAFSAMMAVLPAQGCSQKVLELDACLMKAD
jgi:hypothetical protein